MNKTDIAEHLLKLRELKELIEPEIEAVDALDLQIADLEKRKTSAQAAVDAAQGKHGPESPEYNERSVQCKAFGPRIRRLETERQAAVNEISEFRSDHFEQIVHPILGIHHKQLIAKIVKRTRGLYKGDSEARIAAYSTRPAQLFLNGISCKRADFLADFDLAVQRRNLQLIDELLKPKPDLVKFFGIQF